MIDENYQHEGQDAYRIETPSATYVYQKEAGGFSSIMDSNGIDWIQFKKSDSAYYPSSAASDYRGLPNMVYKSEDGGCGHPGFDKMQSILLPGNRIKSVSKSGKWEWIWSFFSDRAELEVVRTDPDTPYWFLYEGPVAGKFSPGTHYWGNNLDGPLTDTPDLVLGPELYGNWQVVYFGDRNYNQTLFIKKQTSDEIKDLFTYMGNSMEGNESDDGMIVFGFGRDKGATPLLNTPDRFLIGFYNKRISSKGDHLQLLNYIMNIN